MPSVCCLQNAVCGIMTGHWALGAQVRPWSQTWGMVASHDCKLQQPRIHCRTRDLVRKAWSKNLHNCSKFRWNCCLQKYKGIGRLQIPSSQLVHSIELDVSTTAVQPYGSFIQKVLSVANLWEDTSCQPTFLGAVYLQTKKVFFTVANCGIYLSHAAASGRREGGGFLNQDLSVYQMHTYLLYVKIRCAFLWLPEREITLFDPDACD